MKHENELLGMVSSFCIKGIERWEVVSYDSYARDVPSKPVGYNAGWILEPFRIFW
jgi:hypothetical protein